MSNLKIEDNRYKIGDIVLFKYNSKIGEGLIVDKTVDTYFVKWDDNSIGEYYDRELIIIHSQMKIPKYLKQQ